MKNRLLGLLVLVGSVGMLYYNWHMLMTAGYYHRRMSGVSPLGIELGVLMLITPPSWYLQQADTGARRSTLAVGLVFGALVFGIAMGFVNLHLMSSYTR